MKRNKTLKHEKFNTVMAKYRQAPSQSLLDSLIFAVESALLSLDPISKRAEIIDVFGNFIFSPENNMDTVSLKKIISFIEKYSLIFDLSIFFKEITEHIKNKNMSPWSLVRFEIYNSDNFSSLDVIDRMIEKRISSPYDILGFYGDLHWADLNHIKALIGYKKSILLADKMWLNPDEAYIIETIYDLLQDSKRHFQEASQNGNFLAETQMNTLQDLGCFASLPSSGASEEKICYRLLSAMKLHVLSGNSGK